MSDYYVLYNELQNDINNFSKELEFVFKKEFNCSVELIRSKYYDGRAFAIYSTSESCFEKFTKCQQALNEKHPEKTIVLAVIDKGNFLVQFNLDSPRYKNLLPELKKYIAIPEDTYIKNAIKTANCVILQKGQTLNNLDENAYNFALVFKNETEKHNQCACQLLDYQYYQGRFAALYRINTQTLNILNELKKEINNRDDSVTVKIFKVSPDIILALYTTTTNFRLILERNFISDDEFPLTQEMESAINQSENPYSFISLNPNEGRVISTSEAPAPVANFVDNTPSAAPVRKNKVIGKYIPPSLNLLAKEVQQKNANNNAELQQKAMKLQDTLKSFGIDAQVVNITHGPAITRFELTIAIGTKVSKIVGLQDDIALAMAACSVRIKAPIPGKSVIGIEIPNEKTTAVQLNGLLRTDDFMNSEPLSVPLGRDIPGKPVMCNIAKMPHLLIAGSTGSGKSVCINTILTSILYKASPDQVRLILVDPKVVELSIYNGIPHLLMPVVTDPKKASNALKWAVMEMERRYRLFAESSVKDLNEYNEYLKYNGEKELPLIVIVIDELADLMTVAQKEVEDSISRLAVMARAVGIHYIISTGNITNKVITGTIKSNIISRIAFAVPSSTDSRTILDFAGAEKLIGKGDMLYAPLSAPKPIRVQSAFISTHEIEAVVGYLKSQYNTSYDDSIISVVNNIKNTTNSNIPSRTSYDYSSDDNLLDNAVDIVIEAKNASVSILQRRLGIGYPRAARLLDLLEQEHVIGPFEGSKPRKVLITKTDWLEMKTRH